MSREPRSHQAERETDTEKLDLSEAQQRWCDPQLVAAARAAVQEVERRRRSPYVPDQSSGAPPWARVSHSAYVAAARKAVEAALVRIDVDFRMRVDRGEIVLYGVPMEPEREVAQKEFPGIWAADRRLKFYRDTIRGDNFLWIKVYAVRVLLRTTDDLVADHSHSAVSNEAKATIALPDEEPIARRPHGKQSSVPLIKEALQACRDKVEKLPLNKHGTPNMTTVAMLLRKYLRAKYQDPMAVHLPTLKTMQNQLPELYRREFPDDTSR
jgi:hypothetical protein